jgi:molybdate-binding protein/DNA-binding XRE family transcriptional regulator
MAKSQKFENDLRDRRVLRGWSQDELAQRSGLSRAGISAIEIGRLVPSAAAALSLAAALDCRVEDLFRLRSEQPSKPRWAWPPVHSSCRYWSAEIGGMERLYPVEATPMGVVHHDGLNQGGKIQGRGHRDPRRTLIMACCDPAVGILAAELARKADVRLIALQRPSRKSLALLGQGLIHVAGIHLATVERPDGNTSIVRDELGRGYNLIRLARWEEGVAFTPGRFSSIRAAVRSNLCWIGREDGSGARQCLDEVLSSTRTVPRHVASDHRGVAEAIRSGWADAGVCLRLVCEEAGLSFLGVRQEAYDLCFPVECEEDLRIQALLEVVRSSTYRETLGELPGYQSEETGELQQVT